MLQTQSESYQGRGQLVVLFVVLLLSQGLCADSVSGSLNLRGGASFVLGKNLHPDALLPPAPTFTIPGKHARCACTHTVLSTYTAHICIFFRTSSNGTPIEISMCRLRRQWSTVYYPSSWHAVCVSRCMRACAPAHGGASTITHTYRDTNTNTRAHIHTHPRAQSRIHTHVSAHRHTHTKNYAHQQTQHTNKHTQIGRKLLTK